MAFGVLNFDGHCVGYAEREKLFSNSIVGLIKKLDLMS